MDLAAVGADPTAGPPDLDRSERVVGPRCLRRVGGRGSPEDGGDPSNELAGAEGLRHVVVGPHRQPDQHVRLLVARREHHHRDPSIGLDAPAHLEPVEPGQQEIEHHDVGPEVGDRRLVFDHKDVPHVDTVRNPACEAPARDVWASWRSVRR